MCRREALSSITGDRLFVERMAQRPRVADDILDQNFRDEILKQLDKIHVDAQNASNIDDLDDLTDDAELQALFAAYLCPVSEIKIEGDLVLDLIDVWGIPKTSTTIARKLWEDASKALQEKGQIQEARGALYALFAERDAWDDYLDEYDDQTHRMMWTLFVVVVIFLPAAIFAVYFAHSFSPLLMLGILAAGTAGSSASIMSHIPSVEDRLSRKTEANGKPLVQGGGALARTATGLIGTVIGAALLSWIPLSIKGKSFGELVADCTAPSSATGALNPCTPVTILILVGVAAILGFSERTLTFFEERVFGKQQRKRRKKL
jgi:hypothetical protein